MRKLLYIIVATIILAACVGNGKERAALDAAQAIINDRPDSALAILDSLEPSSRDFSRSTLRRWQLLRLMAQNKCDTVFHSDSLQLILTDYFDHHGTPNERMWAHYLLERAYYDMGEAIPALKAYEDAASAADTASADCDFWNLSRVYYQEAELLYYQNLPDEIFEALGNASLAAKKYRQDKGGLWSQKHGGWLVENVDGSGRTIKNPKRADHCYRYSDFTLNYNGGGILLWVKRK